MADFDFLARDSCYIITKKGCVRRQDLDEMVEVRLLLSEASRQAEYNLVVGRLHATSRLSSVRA